MAIDKLSTRQPFAHLWRGGLGIFTLVPAIGGSNPFKRLFHHQVWDGEVLGNVAVLDIPKATDDV